MSPDPVVHVYTLCHNEEILLPYFLRHYGAFAERIIVFDNHSTDRTPDIVRTHEQAELRYFDTGNEIRDDIFLDLKNQCWKESRGHADFVIVCDVDELLYHIDMPRFLTMLKADDFTAVRPMGYAMIGDAPPTTDGQIYEEMTMGVRDTWSDKTVLFAPEAVTEIHYGIGAHYCEPSGHVRLYMNDPALRLFHYRFLGLDFLLQRFQLRQQRMSQANKREQWGTHYLWSENTLRKLFQLHREHAIPVVGHTPVPETGVTSQTLQDEARASGTP